MKVCARFCNSSPTKAVTGLSARLLSVGRAVRQAGRLACMGSVSVAPTLSPHGRLTMVEGADAPPLDPELAQRLRNAFQRGSGHGLLQLGAAEAGATLPPVFSYWREFGAGYVTALCTQPDTRVPAPPAAELERLFVLVPPPPGAGYHRTHHPG